MSERKPRLWVVEIYVCGLERWEPTVGASLIREYGRQELSQWREKNPASKFRCVPYERAER